MSFILPAIAVLLLAGCSEEPETVNEQNVAVCISSGGDVPATGGADVEFRQDGKVVATARTAVGGAVGVRVPTGEIDVYVNGELYGRAVSQGLGALDEKGNLQGGTYFSGPGCPEKPPFV